MRWTNAQDAALKAAAESGGSFAAIAARASSTIGTLVSADMARNRLKRLAQGVKAGAAADNAKGWTPGLEWDGDTGTITTDALSGPVENWDDLLKIWRLDPEVFEIVEPIRFRAWDHVSQGETVRLFHYKATVIRRRVAAEGEEAADIEALKAQIAGHEPTPGATYRGELSGQAFIFALADLQTGKGENGGTEALIERFMSGLDAAERRLGELRARGLPLSTVYILGMGDLIEACSGHYAQQQFRVDLNHRDQMKVVRRLVLAAIKRFAPVSLRVVVAAVPGNHGENRLNGKSYTDFADNEDVAVIEQVAEIVAENPDAYGHVEFILPEGDDLTLLVDIGGTRVGLAHGHQYKRPNQAVTWWQGQAFGEQTVAGADVLITAHFHHLLVITTKGGKTHIQCPSLDGGSAWYTQTTGESSPPGLLSLVVGPEGWSDLQVLS